jgi:hypothetical protein
MAIVKKKSHQYLVPMLIHCVVRVKKRKEKNTEQKEKRK